MNLKKIYIVLFLILLFAMKVHGQDDPGDPYGGDGPPDPGGNIPIPGILYFLIAMLGIGVKKIWDVRKNRDES